MGRVGNVGEAMIGDRTQGTRVEYTRGPIPALGSYWQRDGIWYGVTPNGHLCSVANHEIVAHDDGTITVSPSIRVSVGPMVVWHGFLERGVWREV